MKYDDTPLNLSKFDEHQNIKNTQYTRNIISAFRLCANNLMIMYNFNLPCFIYKDNIARHTCELVYRYLTLPIFSISEIRNRMERMIIRIPKTC